MTQHQPIPVHLFILNYVRTHPFSVMAISNIIGDSCYIGYAFKADLFVSYPKLAGALFAILAQFILLAYGDKQAQRVAGEKGQLSLMLLRFRAMCQAWMKRWPPAVIAAIEKYPVGIPFAMLALNGVGLFIDSLVRLLWDSEVARISQAVVGGLIVCGTGVFALADFVPSQKIANSLLRMGPRILVAATVSNVVLSFSTFNPFLLTGSLAFLMGNLAGFFAKIDKKSSDSAVI